MKSQQNRIELVARPGVVQDPKALANWQWKCVKCVRSGSPNSLFLSERGLKSHILLTHPVTLDDPDDFPFDPKKADGLLKVWPLTFFFLFPFFKKNPSGQSQIHLQGEYF